MRKITFSITSELCALLGIVDGADDNTVSAAIVATAKKAATVDTIKAQLTTANAAKETAENALEALKGEKDKAEIKDMLDAALTGKKITVALRDQFTKDYEGKPKELKTVLEGLGAYTSVVKKIEADAALTDAKYAGKSWDELRQNNLLKEMKKNHFEAYKKVWEEEHGQAYPEPTA